MARILWPLFFQDTMYIQCLSHKQVSKWHHFVNFQNMKSLKYTFCREFNSEYKLRGSFWWHHCDISYKHYRWQCCRRKYPTRNSVLLFVFLWPKGLSANAIRTQTNPMKGDECVMRPSIHVWCKKFARGRESVDEQWPGQVAIQPAIRRQHFFHQAFTSLLIVGINA